jgi:hypothetical protein
MAHTHIARGRFPYGKHYLNEGDRFTPVSEQEAALYEQMGLAAKAPADAVLRDPPPQRTIEDVIVTGTAEQPPVSITAGIAEDASEQVEPEVQAVKRRGRPRKSE